MSKHAVLFVSHDAGPTGAPFLLLHLLRWLRANAPFELHVLLKQGGVLEPEFSELAPTVTYGESGFGSAGKLIRRTLPGRARRALDARTIRRWFARREFAAIYSNTLVNGSLLRLLSGQRSPLISHAHELDYMLGRFTSPPDLAHTMTRTRRFVAGSHAVADNLMARHGIAEERIEVVHEFIPVEQTTAGVAPGAAARVRGELSIDRNAFVVCAAGTLDWRKGADLFIALAVNVVSRAAGRDIHFVWIGGGATREVSTQLEHDVGKAGLAGRFHFVGYRPDYLACIAASDAFCLVSREDPYPLVVLEAAALGKPVLCFERGGGSPEFVRTDCGFVVPYLDVNAMGGRLLELLTDPGLKSRLGLRGSEKVAADNDVSSAGPRIARIIERVIGDSGGR